jgi:hypothetical protein
MRAMWALFSLECRRFWAAPLVATLLSLGAIGFTGAGLVAGPVFATGIVTMLAFVLGGRAVDGQARFVFAAPVPWWAMFGAACGSMLVIGAAALVAGVLPIVLTSSDGPGPARMWLGQSGLLLVMAAVALLVGASVAGQRAGVREAILGPIALVAVVASFAWAVPRTELLLALPFAMTEANHWMFWAGVLAVAGVAVAAFARSLARGRGEPRQTLSTMWRAAIASVVGILMLTSSWMGYLHSADADDVVHVRHVRLSDTGVWALVSGDIVTATTIDPTFIVRLADGWSARVPGLNMGQPAAFSRDGRVMAALLVDRSSSLHEVPLLVCDLDAVPSWRPTRDVALDAGSVRIALSPSGSRLAIRTSRSVTVLDTATGQRVARFEQTDAADGVFVFRDENSIVAERLAAATPYERDVEIVMLDVARGVAAIGGRYQRNARESGTSSVDEGARFMAVSAMDSGWTRVTRFDLNAADVQPRTWTIDRANALIGAPLVLPDGRVVVLKWGTRYGASELRVLGDEMLSVPLDERWSGGMQWLGGDRVALGRSRYGPAADTASVVVGLDGVVRQRLEGLVPAQSFSFRRPFRGSRSVAFIADNNRIVMRPDLLQ